MAALTQSSGRHGVQTTLAKNAANQRGDGDLLPAILPAVRSPEHAGPVGIIHPGRLTRHADSKR
jgi:hypothetical protein